MDRLEAKRLNCLEAVTELLALLERCKAFNWAGRFHAVKDALSDYDLDKAISLYKSIPMPNMGGFLDLILCKENGHSVRDKEIDNKLLINLGSSLSQTISNLEIYMTKKIDKARLRLGRANRAPVCWALDVHE